MSIPEIKEGAVAGTCPESTERHRGEGVWPSPSGSSTATLLRQNPSWGRGKGARHRGLPPTMGSATATQDGHPKPGPVHEALSNIHKQPRLVPSTDSVDRYASPALEISAAEAKTRPRNLMESDPGIQEEPVEAPAGPRPCARTKSRNCGRLLQAARGPAWLSTGHPVMLERRGEVRG